MMPRTSPASSASLHVVALISGGKDSIFSLLHCLANNHNVVALANLFPAGQKPHALKTPQETSPATAGWDKDVDSWMFQTAGHNLLPRFSEALGLPLYRQEITGGPQDSALSYAGHDEDETEALIPLLMRVKNAHPEINAVSSGAILSTYQRTRVESVALRLNLVPLAYLWQYPSLPPPSPSGLLQDMANAGFDIRIVKVASGGLDNTLLWSNLMDSSSRSKLERAVSRFGGSVLGEGGEYETMVVCGPSDIAVVQGTYDHKTIGVQYPTTAFRTIDHLWRGRIDVASADMLTATEPGLDGAASLSFRHGSGNVTSISPLVPDSKSPIRVRPVLKIPGIWDRKFHKLLEDVYRFSSDCNIPVAASAAGDTVDIETNTQSWKDGKDQFTSIGVPLQKVIHISQVQNLYIVQNLTGMSAGNTASEQMAATKHDLLSILEQIKRATSSIIFTTIIISSMADFSAINVAYGELFKKPNPPARVTVACPLPPDIKVMMSVIINMTDECDPLHVQSRSYWAPANIGPYSQAISVPFYDTKHPSLVFVAGQIPLVPGTMELLSVPTNDHEDSTNDILPLQSEFLQRCCLSLQHLWRIGQEMKVNWWTGAIAFITRGDDSFNKATIAWTAWQEIHKSHFWEESEENEDENELDVWYVKHGGRRDFSRNANAEHCLPDFNKLKSAPHDVYALLSDDNTKSFKSKVVDCSKVPGFFAVEINELPRNSDIEWQSLGIARGGVSIITTNIINGDESLQVRNCMIGNTRICLSFIDIPFPGLSDKLLMSRRVSRGIGWLRNVSAPTSDILITIYTLDTALTVDFEAQIIPCHAVWGSQGRRLGAGIVAQFEVRDRLND